jgi:cell division protein FtsZ
MGIGVANGDARAIHAVKEAITSPLLDSSIDGAKGVLINISGGPDMTMLEVDEAANMVSQAVDPEADIIFGATIKPELQDYIKITLIATKFDESVSVVRRRTDITRVTEEKTQLVVEESTRKSDGGKRTENSYELENDPFDVPAFLRKK